MGGFHYYTFKTGDLQDKILCICFFGMGPNFALSLIIILFLSCKWGIFIVILSKQPTYKTNIFIGFHLFGMLNNIILDTTQEEH